MTTESTGNLIHITVPEGMTVERLLELAARRQNARLDGERHDCSDCGHKDLVDGHCKMYSSTCATAVMHRRTATYWTPIK